MNRIAFLFVALLTACASSSGDEADVAGQQVNATDQDPAPGTPERSAFIKAVHKTLDPQLGSQKNEYVVSWLKSKSGFTFLQAEVRGAGTAVDWSKTDFAAQVKSGAFADENGATKVIFTAAAKKSGDTYEVLEVIVAPFGFPQAGAAKGVPAEILPAGDGDGDGGDGDGGDGDGEGDGDLPESR